MKLKNVRETEGGVVLTFVLQLSDCGNEIGGRTIHPHDVGKLVNQCGEKFSFPYIEFGKLKKLLEVRYGRN